MENLERLQKIEQLNAKYESLPKEWVNSTDTFMSGWGKSSHKTNRCTVPSYDYKETAIIKHYMESRSDQNRIMTSIHKPQSNNRRLVSDLVEWRVTAANYVLDSVATMNDGKDLLYIDGFDVLETARRMAKETEI